MIWRLCGAWVLILRVLGMQSAQADAFALQARAEGGGVDVQRAGTDSFIPLRENSVFPLGAGDVVQTDALSRVHVTLPDALELMVMPASRLTVVSAASSDGQAEMQFAVDGQLIARVNTADLRLTLETSAARFTTESAHFAVWGGYEDGAGVSVAAGTVAFASVTDDPLSAGESAFVLAETVLRGVPRPPFNHVARLLSVTVGCPARVQTNGARVLNVRAGPGTGYTLTGYVDDGAEVYLMGSTASGWYRIQTLTGFGWVLSTAVDGEEGCASLVTYPSTFLERNTEVFNVTPFEAPLVAPFYGLPGQNPWFYRSRSAG